MGKTKLGEGHGLVLAKGECQWVLQTYTTEPFLTVQVIWTNRSRKTVKVRELLPLYARLPLPGTATSMEQESVGDEQATDVSIRDTYALLQDPGTGTFLLAAFLTHNTSRTRIYVQPSEKVSRRAVSEITAADVYDPPVEVPPGGTLTSDLLYLAVGEQDPSEAALRFKSAVEKLHSETAR